MLNFITCATNYRLGYLGFLTYDEAGISGNQGIKDQRMAMKWVHDNIEAFGGNKDDVTLFGESSGGKAVEFHLVSEQSKPYFKRAIIQSTYTDPHATRQDSNAITDILITQFQLRFKCSLLQSGIECLKNLPYEDLLEINDYYTGNSTLSFYGARSYLAPETDIERNPLETDIAIILEGARPYIDGVDIKDQPSALYKTGEWSADKDVIIGHTNGENTVIELLPYPVGKKQATEWAMYAFGGTVGSTVMDTYETIYPDLNSAELLGDAMSDYWFNCYIRSIARDMENTGTGNIYFYEFSQPSSAKNVNTGEGLGARGKAIHAAELEYLFGVPYTGLTSFTFSGDDEFLSKLMMEVWGNYASIGVPTSQHLPNGWPKYTPDLDSKWPSLNIASKDLSIKKNIYDDVCSFWDDTKFWA